MPEANASFTPGFLTAPASPGATTNYKLFSSYFQIVKSRTVTAPPGSPAELDMYLVPPSGATGDWAGQANKLAVYYSGAWNLYALPEAACAAVVDAGELVRRQAAGTWVVVDATALAAAATAQAAADAAQVDADAAQTTADAAATAASNAQTTANTANTAAGTAQATADAALPRAGGTMTGPIGTTPATVAFSAAPSFDCAANDCFALGTITSDFAITLANPAVGRSGTIALTQSGVGGFKITGITATGFTVRMIEAGATLNTAEFIAAGAYSLLGYRFELVGGVSVCFVWMGGGKVAAYT